MQRVIYDNWKALLFLKVYWYSEAFFSCHAVASFEISVLKEVRVLRYLHKNRTTLIEKRCHMTYSVFSTNFTFYFHFLHISFILRLFHILNAYKNTWHIYKQWLNKRYAVYKCKDDIELKTQNKKRTKETIKDEKN